MVSLYAVVQSENVPSTAQVCVNDVVVTTSAADAGDAGANATSEPTAVAIVATVAALLRLNMKFPLLRAGECDRESVDSGIAEENLRHPTTVLVARVTGVII